MDPQTIGRTNDESFLVRRPCVVLLLASLGIVLFSAWAAIGPVHRNDIPRYWSFDFFMTVLSGPLGYFFSYPNPSTSDYAIAGILTVVFGAVIIRYLRRPSKVVAYVAFVLMFIWVWSGVGVTFAWV